MITSNEKLSALIVYIQSGGRVCPQPQQWKELWEMLPNKHQDGVSRKPSLPLILAAWHNTTDAEKKSRFKEHIEYAATNGVLDDVEAYIMRLTHDQWYHEDAD